MKKIVLTAIILLGVTLGAYAQQYHATGTGWTLRLFSTVGENEEELGIGLFEDGNNPWDETMEEGTDYTAIRNLGGGLFGRGEQATGVGSGFRTTAPLFGFPGSHGNPEDANAPLGSGLLSLIGFGVAYAMKKRREK